MPNNNKKAWAYIQAFLLLLGKTICRYNQYKADGNVSFPRISNIFSANPKPVLFDLSEIFLLNEKELYLLKYF
jgi:uncharacterized membrane protein YhdT